MDSSSLRLPLDKGASRNTKLEINARKSTLAVKREEVRRGTAQTVLFLNPATVVLMQRALDKNMSKLGCG